MKGVLCVGLIVGVVLAVYDGSLTHAQTESQRTNVPAGLGASSDVSGHSLLISSFGYESFQGLASFSLNPVGFRALIVSLQECRQVGTLTDGTPLWSGQCESPPTPTPTPTSTSVPPSPTPQPSSTPVPTATTIPPTSTPAITTRPFPPRQTDGRYTITQPGVYSGAISCGTISGGDYCLNINAQGVTLQDFTVTSASSFGSILTSSNTTFLRGTITGRGGITGYRVQNVLIDSVTFNVSVGALGIYDQGEGCEALTTKRTRGITLVNSTVNNSSLASETGWFKCSQDVRIIDNRFSTSSEWSLSFPDALDVTISGNVFDLSPEPRNWLAIELPRTFRVSITGNTFTGPAGDWGVWLNSGSLDVTYAGNVVAGGMGLVCCAITAPSTGSAGMKW